MSCTRWVLIAVFATLGISGCEGGKEKVVQVGKKVDQALDRLDRDEAANHLTAAKEAIASGREATVPCTWAATPAADSAPETARPAVSELRRICSLDVPLGRATRAVTKAEAARAEQPDAPILTECSSDEWPKAKQRLERDHPSDPRLADLRSRWTKVCPGS